MNKEIRVNGRIRVPEVRLVDENGGQLGVVPTREAMDLARSRGFDLIEIAPSASPPVCKLMDYGKFKYEQGRRDREAHKKQKTTEVKGIRLRPGTDEHDLDVKKRHLLDFLKQGNKVKTTVIFRSREMSHPEFARKSLEYLAEQAAEIAVLEKPPSFEGRTMTMILSPRPPEIPPKGEKKKHDDSAAPRADSDGAQAQPDVSASEAEAASTQADITTGNTDGASPPATQTTEETSEAAGEASEPQAAVVAESKKKKDFALDPNQI